MEETLQVKRRIRHAIETVFNAWTEPDLLAQWFAPRGCTLLVKKLQIVKGGEFHWCVKNPKYPDCWCAGNFLAIEYPSIIQYRIRLSDEFGNPVSAQEVFKDKDWPEETLVTVRFSSIDSGTEITITQSVSDKLARKTGAYHGWIEMVDILEEQLAKFVGA